MVSYILSAENPTSQYIQLKAIFDVHQEKIVVRLPSWRPGRYELGNFAKNIKGFKVFDDTNKRLSVSKLTKDSWEVCCIDTRTIRIEYSYYASELNAGSTFLSKEQLYVNPVNCFVYTDEQAQDAIELKLIIPSSWSVAGSMPQQEHTLTATNFDDLADSPFICSPKLQHDTYLSGETNFHVWFHGEVKPDWERVLSHFKAFTDKQIEKFQEFPTSEYHFLIQILPYKAYHGVEHCKSTVITLGPSYDVFGSLYKELLGVSSHELYHTWNVKAIRPIEMHPYDFTKENYSQLGFLCEGVTTYMGDLFLLKSTIFSLNEYFVELNKQLQKHFDNAARFNYSVAESSFDTWLDGYVPGAPGRKVSIYTEGCLLAFVTDVMILRSTNNKYGLDEVMKRLYFNYSLQGKGVSEADYLTELENISGISFKTFFKEFVHGTFPYESILTESFDYLGLQMNVKPSGAYSQAVLGFKTIPAGNNFIITSLYPGSPAELGGLMLNDEVIAVNDYVCSGELDKWLTYFDANVKTITVVRSGKLIQCQLPEVNRFFYSEYSVSLNESANNLQKRALQAWMS
jgi:predicted metalloprotease with PDZ domain